MRRTAALILVLSSCTVAPPTVQNGSEPTKGHALSASSEAGSVRHSRSGKSLACEALSGWDSMPIRVGIEYLPESVEQDAARSLLPATAGSNALDIDASTALLRPRDLAPEQGMPMRIRAARNPSSNPDLPESSTRRFRNDDTKASWFLSEDELDAIEDPNERLTQSFIQDVVGEDRRRMQRELRTPLLTNPIRSSIGDSLWIPADDLAREEEADFLNQSVSRLLRRPLRRLLKRATIVKDLEVALEEFKADNVPLSNAYREDHPDRRSWGRVSLRLRLSDGSDPAEISYYNSGWRIGSGKERGRVQYRFNVGDQIFGSVGYRIHYETRDTSLRADLRYVVDDATSVHVLMGDRLDFLAGPTAYSLLNSPLDGTPGVLFYVEHLF